MEHENIIFKNTIEDEDSVKDLDDKESTECENYSKHGFIDLLICAIITVFVLVYCYFFFYAFYSFRPKAINLNKKTNTSNSTNLIDTIIKYEYKPLNESPKIRKNSSLKFMLQWRNPDMGSSSRSPNMGNGRNEFDFRTCAYSNCFITSNRSYFDDYRDFDVILFSATDISYNYIKKPLYRSQSQKYVFVSNESPEDYPICNAEYNDFFNWTLSHKLDSDILWGYIIIRDLNNTIIGPKINMTWLKTNEMSPLSKEFLMNLSMKSRAVAWLATSCHGKKNRNIIVYELQNELGKYKCENHTCRVDIFGECGTHKCSREDEVCNSIIREKYFFYMSFENSFSDDFVTDELLKALDNNAVPIVYGGANYSRFLPNGSYLDANILNPQELAAKIHELMNNQEKYAEYFKWKNHYVYQHTRHAMEIHGYCRLCSLINNESNAMKTKIYKNFSEWWSPNPYCTEEFYQGK